MNIEKKTVVALAGGLSLTMGLVIILVLSSMIMPLPVLQQIMDPYFIFIFSLLAVFPLVSRRLNRCDRQNTIIGWTLIGLGTQFLVLPLPLLLLIFKLPPDSGILFGGIILAGSVVFGMPAGLLCAAAGVYLVKRR